MRSAPTDERMERLTELVRAERGRLSAVARREGLSPEDALECVQDALCTFLTHGAASEHELATLMTMVRNAARNARRRHRHALPHDAIDDDAHRAGGASAEELVLRAEDVLRLRVCLAELCGSHRAAITLRLLDERSGEDVAAELGLTRAHVDVLVHRAKAALRICMREPGRPCRGGR